MSGPANLSILNNQYAPNPFDLVATVFNNGTGPATDVALTLEFPAGLTLATGAVTQRIGVLDVGQEQQVSWSVRATAQSSLATANYAVTVSASNAPSKTVTRSLTLPPLQIAVPTPTPTPAPPAQTAPPRHTTSYYMQSTDIRQAMQLGCDARIRNETGIVVLDFGSPRSRQQFSSATRQLETVYSAQLVRQSTYVDLEQIELLMFSFAVGYADPYSRFANYTCVGLPSDPRQIGSAKLTLAAGVSNSGIQNRQGIWRDNEYLTKEHGAAWANMVNRIDTLFKNPPLINDRRVTIYPRVRAAAGYDAEYYQAPFADTRDAASGRRGATPAADHWTTYPGYSNKESAPVTWTDGTRAWADGYHSVASRTKRLRYYNFGSCEDCPRRGTPDDWQTNPTTTEILERVYGLNWSRSNQPLPQIYFAPRPNEWYNVRWYVNSVHSRTMTFPGLMTQCGSSGCSTADTGRLEPFNCDTTGLDCQGDWEPYKCAADCPNFPPSQGWQALADTIGSRTTPQGNLNTDIAPQTRLDAVTDIAFQDVRRR